MSHSIHMIVPLVTSLFITSCPSQVPEDHPMEKVHPMASPGMILGPGMDLKLKAEHQVHKFQEITIYYIYI